MIRSKDLNAEIKILEDRIAQGIVNSADVVKALCLVAKTLRDIRQNQVTDMKSRGVKLIEPEERPEKKEELREE
jgi:hypothetical protein